MSFRTLLAPLRAFARPAAASCTCTPLLASTIPSRRTLPSLRFASTQVEQSLPSQVELPESVQVGTRPPRRKGPPPKPAPNSKWTLPRGVELEGTVIRSGKMAKTCTVSVERKVTDHKTLKVFTRHSKFLVHDPNTELVDGDVVLIRSCRKVSARKNFEFVSLIKGSDARQSVLTSESADVAELAQEKAEKLAAELEQKPAAKKDSVETEAKSS
ncbi:hypothetical protein JCM10296v2_002617 [Rhodotorula toruloides]